MINILNKKLTTYIILALIVIIATFLRFYQLGVNPPSLNWDETSLGYNAYSILKTGSDEYGTFLPLNIRSFDDYKPPMYAYLTIPFVAVFELNEFAVRFPSAVAGVLTVITMYFLVKELLFKWEGQPRERIALVAAFFLAISPWHLQFSRAAFEGNIGLFFFVAGLWLFLKGLKNSKLFLASIIFFILSLYSYHSFRLLIPLLLGFLAVVFWKDLVRKRIISLAVIILFMFFAAPVYLSFLTTRESGSRLSMVTIFSDPNFIESSIAQIELAKNNNDPIGILLGNRRLVFGLAVVKGYLDHFNPDFLFLHGDGGVQHHAVDMGMLYLWDLPFILLGIYVLLNRRNRYAAVIFALFLFAPLPAAITTGTPHPVRAIAMVPGLHIFAAVGVVFFIERLLKSKYRFYRSVLLMVVFSTLTFNIMYYFYQYYVRTPIAYGYFWQYGYKQIVKYAKEHENQFDKILITYKYDQPYIYYLFYNKIDPSWYQKNWDYNKNGHVDRFKRVIGKYEFRAIDWAKDKNIPNALIIASPDEVPQEAAVIQEIRFLDGRLAFKIIGT